MATGAETVIAKLGPVLTAFARKIIFVGPAGFGQIMKLSVNLVVHGLKAVLFEALQLVESAGITRKPAYAVLQESVVTAPLVKYKSGALLDEDEPVSMSLDLVRKELLLIAACRPGRVAGNGDSGCRSSRRRRNGRRHGRV